MAACTLRGCRACAQELSIREITHCMKKDEFGDYTEAAAKVRVLAGTLCAPCVSRKVCVLCVALCALQYKHMSGHKS